MSVGSAILPLLNKKKKEKRISQMKVYLIETDYEGCSPWVFSTREKAENHLQMFYNREFSAVIEVEVE